MNTGYIVQIAFSVKQRTARVKPDKAHDFGYAVELNVLHSFHLVHPSQLTIVHHASHLVDVDDDACDELLDQVRVRLVAHRNRGDHLLVCNGQRLGIHAT